MSEELLLTPDYRTQCLWCGGQLYPIAFTPESAPWVCVICHQAWWAVELSEAARSRFRPALCDFGFGPGLDVLQQLVIQERDDARLRETSVRSDQVQSLPLYVLERLPRDATPFGEMIGQEIKRKGG